MGVNNRLFKLLFHFLIPFSVWISEIMSGKKRAFFLHPKNVEAAKKIFNIKPNEEIIVEDSPESLKKNQKMNPILKQWIKKHEINSKNNRKNDNQKDTK